jgi:hypothetical protein
VFGSVNATDASGERAPGREVSMPASGDGTGGGRLTMAGRYRRTGLALFLLGVAAGAGAALAGTAALRELLVAFAGAGVFGSVLAFWIRPGGTDDVDPSERVHAALAATGDALVRDLALDDRRVYVPGGDTPDGFAPVTLALARDGEPAPEGVRPVFGTDQRGLSSDAGGAPALARSGVTVYPTGGALFDAYERVATDDLAADPVELGDQLATGAVAGLELAAGVDPDVDAPGGTATATVTRPAFGPAVRFDHPVASFLGAGFALGLGTPVTVETLRVGEAEFRVVCEWDPDAVGAATGE